MGKLEVSQRRIDANRRNATRSTGPRTEAGKAQSRRNSLIHGLAGDGIVVPEHEAQAARERAEQWNSSLRPMNAFEMGLVETIAIESVRVDRCRIEERIARDVRARRASACWADERRAEAAKLGRTLADCPEEVAPRLAMTAAGCDWLIARWTMLGKALNRKGTWTDEQATLALDLLGIAADLRDEDSPIEAGMGVDLVEHRRELVEAELDGLVARQEEALDAIDDDLREATSMGLVAADDPTLVLLRRYETASLRRQRWALELLQRGRQRREPAPQVMTDDYRERPRDLSYARPPAREFPGDPTPTPDPGSTDPGSDRTGRPAGDNRAAQSRPISPNHLADRPGNFAERSHLAGRLLLLARSLAARNAARRPSIQASGLLARPSRRLARPSVAPSGARAGALSLRIA
ncbi:hypothetical protein EP7_000168 [Isosphaeraceae bacterium EP7]